MKLVSISISEGFEKRFIKFSDNINLIFSEQNSKGKTTLLRFLLYGLGFSVPSTKKIKFEKCEVILAIKETKIGDIIIQRNNNKFADVFYEGSNHIFVLPEQTKELHSIIFGTKNEDILNNILGTFYFDQEKGWTMLNRGVVIGSIHFNIEELIRGLYRIDCKKLIEEKNRLIDIQKKYEQMFNVAQYRETIWDSSITNKYNSYSEKIETQKNIYLWEESQLLAEIKRIDSALKDNKQIKKYISEMKLIIQLDNGDLVPITENNILGLNDSIDFLTSKKKITSRKLSEIRKKIEESDIEQTSDVEQKALYQTEPLIDLFDQKIINMPINQYIVKKELDSVKCKIKFIKDKINTMTYSDISINSPIYKNILKYGTELKIWDEASINPSYIFTSNLKELSGAILHKTVFVFKLAYLTEVQKNLSINLPIIMDSPRGKEIDQENIDDMMNILKRDFPNNQIIIASIYNYDFDEINLIKIRNKLIEQE